MLPNHDIFLPCLAHYNTMLPTHPGQINRTRNPRHTIPLYLRLPINLQIRKFLSMRRRQKQLACGPLRTIILQRIRTATRQLPRSREFPQIRDKARLSVLQVRKLRCNLPCGACRACNGETDDVGGKSGGRARAPAVRVGDIAGVIGVTARRAVAKSAIEEVAFDDCGAGAVDVVNVPAPASADEFESS